MNIVPAAVVNKTPCKRCGKLVSPKGLRMHQTSQECLSKAPALAATRSSPRFKVEPVSARSSGPTISFDGPSLFLVSVNKAWLWSLDYFFKKTMEATIFMPVWLTLLVTFAVGPVTLVYTIMNKMTVAWKVIVALWNLMFTIVGALTAFLTQLALVVQKIGAEERKTVSSTILSTLGTSCIEGKKIVGGASVDCIATPSDKFFVSTINLLFDTPTNITNWTEKVEGSFSLWEWFTAARV